MNVIDTEISNLQLIINKLGYQGADFKIPFATVQHAYRSAVSGKIDRYRIPLGQVCYKSDIVTSLVSSRQFVRAYIDIDDLDDFSEGNLVAIKLPYGFNNTVQGKITKIYSVSETKDLNLMKSQVSGSNLGVVIEIAPLKGKSWKGVHVSNIPVRVRKLKFS